MVRLYNPPDEGGTGGTPGGLNTQIQYNNAGAFGGISGAVTDGTSVSLTGAHLLNPTINGAGVGLATLVYPNTAANATITFPTTTNTLATLAGSEALTNKSVNGVTLTTGGGTTTFLNASGTYSTPVGTVYTGTTNRITVTGTVIDIAATYIGQSSITTLGTITTGVWNGTAIANANLANSTISGVALGGTLAALTATNTTLTFSGSYDGTTARTVGINLATANTWTGAVTVSTTPLTISGNQSAAAWITAGIGLKTIAATYTDTSSTGTVAGTAVHAFARPTLIASSATTYTNSATVYIENAPLSSTNVTQGTALALWVANGASLFNGLVTGVQFVSSATVVANAFQTNSSTTASNFVVVATGAGTSTNAISLFAGATTINQRALFQGSTSTVLGANNAYGAVIIGSMPINAAATGTHALLANLVVNPVGTVTNGSAIPITNTATLYVNGAGSGGSSNYALMVNTGTTYLGGKVANYNAVTTAGWGIPAIYGTGRSTAQTAAVASVAAYTVGAADGSFLVSANVLVTTATVHSFTATVAYTDEGNTARTLTLQFSTLAGAFITAITNAQGTVPYEGVPLHLRCKAATAITIATVGTFTTVTYNVEGMITQIA